MPGEQVHATTCNGCRGDGAPDPPAQPGGGNGQGWGLRLCRRTGRTSSWVEIGGTGRSHTARKADHGPPATLVALRATTAHRPRCRVRTVRHCRQRAHKRRGGGTGKGTNPNISNVDDNTTRFGLPSYRPMKMAGMLLGQAARLHGQLGCMDEGGAGFERGQMHPPQCSLLLSRLELPPRCSRNRAAKTCAAAGEDDPVARTNQATAASHQG